MRGSDLLQLESLNLGPLKEQPLPSAKSLAQQRVLLALAGDLGLVTSTHTVADNHRQLQIQGMGCPLWSPLASGMLMEHMHSSKQNTHTHEKYNFTTLFKRSCRRRHMAKATQLMEAFHILSKGNHALVMTINLSSNSLTKLRCWWVGR